MGLLSLRALALFAVISFGLSCSPSGAAEAEGPVTQVSRLEALRVAALNHAIAKPHETGSEQNALIDYYSNPKGHVLWVNDSGLTPLARSVIAEIEKADDYGLRAADYDVPKLDMVDGENHSDVAWLADAEIKISVAVLRYARDARGGRLNPQRLSKNLDPTLALADPLQVMEAIATSADPATYLRSFQPKQPQFEALRKALIAARTRSSKESDVKIPDGPVLKLGVEHAQVALLRKRLKVGEADASGKEMLFDTALDQAVKRFQADRDVTPDGLVGPVTRRLLNERDQDARIRHILLNMERWRWLPDDLGSYYVIVNVPEFLLRVVADGKAVHTARVVVGQPDMQTPIFSNQIQEIVFNPYWSVPNAIKIEEIRPYITTESSGFFGSDSWNISVLTRNNLRTKIRGHEVDPSKLDWNRIDIKSLDIYQPPGAHNVLGNIKFVFPNRHDVYMHDTVQKSFFAKRVRAESHGCMRVQNPDQLALLLLKRDQGWTVAKVASAIQSGYDQHIALQQKVPVYITYFTLWAQDDGSISTFSDVYGHDARMAAVLFANGIGSHTPKDTNKLHVNPRPRVANSMSIDN